MHLKLEDTIYIFIIYTPNLGLRSAVPGWERKQGHFRGSSEGVRGRSEGVGASTREARGSTGAHHEKRGSGSSESPIWLHLTFTMWQRLHVQQCALRRIKCLVPHPQY